MNKEKNIKFINYSTLAILFPLLMLARFWCIVDARDTMGLIKTLGVLDFFSCFIEDIGIWVILLFLNRMVFKIKITYSKLILFIILFNLVLLLQLIDVRLKVLLMQPLNIWTIVHFIKEINIFTAESSFFWGKRFLIGFVFFFITLNISFSLLFILNRKNYKLVNNLIIRFNSIFEKIDNRKLGIAVVLILLIISFKKTYPYHLGRNPIFGFVFDIFQLNKKVEKNYKNIGTDFPVYTMVSKHNQTNKNSMTMKPNIIIYILESASYKETIGSNHEYKMPFILSLKKRGAKFLQCYSEIAISTKSLFSILTGLSPSSTFEILESRIPNLSGIAQIVKTNSYKTFLISGQKLHYHRMRQQAKNMGFEEIYEFKQLKALGAKRGKSYTTVGFGGLDDRIMFEYSLENLKKNQPFLLVYYTTSSHYPYYKASESQQKSDYENYKSSLTYADSVLKELFDKLKKREIMNNTLFVITSDHGEHFHNNGTLKGRAPTVSEDAHKIPLIFFSPNLDLSNIPVSTARQIDIVPTILEISGIKFKNLKIQGQSLLNNNFNPYPIYLNSHGGSRLSAIIYEKAKYIYSFDSKKAWMIDFHKNDTDKNLKQINIKTIEKEIQRLNNYNRYNEAYLRSILLN